MARSGSITPWSTALWVSAPDGLPDATVATLAESDRQKIREELDLMGLWLEERGSSASVH